MKIHSTKFVFSLFVLMFWNVGLCESELRPSPLDQKLYENEHFSVQVSKKVEPHSEIIGEGDYKIKLTILAENCIEASVTLTHMFFNSLDEPITLDELKDESYALGEDSENDEIYVAKTEETEVNNYKAIKHTMKSNESSSFLLYVYLWADKNQFFQLGVGSSNKMHETAFEKDGKKYTYLDVCPAFYNYTKTLKLK